MSIKEKVAVFDVLEDCIKACDSYLSACLQQDEIEDLRKGVGLLTDCIRTCRKTSASVKKKGFQVQHLLLECSKICRLCAEECSAYPETKYNKGCIAACNRCVIVCNKEIFAFEGR